MSFDYPQEPRRRSGGSCGGLMMLLIAGAVMYLFMTARGGGPRPGGDVNNDARPSTERGVSRSEVDRQLREADEMRRKREEVFGSKNTPENGKQMPEGQPRRNSDWSIEDVDGKNRKAAVSSTENKKTVGKDGWSIEEVPSKKNSGADFRLKNSDGSDVKVKEKSDWSVEDVDPKTKKTTEGDWSVEEVKKGKGK